MIYNLETLETSNGIRTNVLQQKLGLVTRTTKTMLGLTQYPQGLGLVSHTTNMFSNLQIDSSVIQIVHQMFYATQSILRPLSRTPSLGAVVSTRPNTYNTKNKLRLGLQLLISSQGQSHGELQKDLSAEPSCTKPQAGVSPPRRSSLVLYLSLIHI